MRRPVDERGEAAQDVALHRQHPLGRLALALAQGGQAAAQEAHRAAGEVAHRLVHRPLVVRREGLRREAVGGVPRERRVQLGDAPAHQRGGLEVGAHQLVGLLGHGAVRAVEEQALPRGRRGGARLDPLGDHLLVEPAEGVEGVLPRVPLVGDELVEDREGGRLSAVGAVLERPRHGRRVLVAGALHQVAAELEVGVHPRLDPPEQLQDEALAEEHRRVALLGAEDRGVGRLVAVDGPPSAAVGEPESWPPDVPFRRRRRRTASSSARQTSGSSRASASTAGSARPSRWATMLRGASIATRSARSPSTSTSGTE